MATKKTSNKELFVVTATEFSYNDEVYSVEGDGGQPLSAFFDKKEAEAFVVQATAKWLKEMGSDGLAGHGYGLDEIFEKPPAFLSQEEQASFFESDCTVTSIENLKFNRCTDEQLAQIAAVLTFSPFVIHKVTVE